MIVRGALASTHPHSCWCQLPGNLSKCSCQAGKPGPVPSPAPWGSLGSLCCLQKPGYLREVDRVLLTRPWPESLHVATSQMCQDMAAREGTGLAEPRGVGPGEEPARPFPVRRWALLPRPQA